MYDKSKRDSERLGRSFHQAQRELVRKFIWSLLVKTGQDKCYRCDKMMDWKTYSIDHTNRWRGSETPIEAFFDIEKIVASHKGCNTSGQ